MDVVVELEGVLIDSQLLGHDDGRLGDSDQLTVVAVRHGPERGANI